MTFKVNDHVVYPLHGVGIIQKTYTQRMNDAEKEFFKIKMEDTGLFISVSTDAAEENGLRKIINKTKITTVLKQLSVFPDKIEDNWKLRFQENIDKLKNGEIENIVSVIKELFVRNKIKTLSIMERKQYESAYKILVKEISIASETDEQEVNTIISSKLDDLAAHLESITPKK